MSTTGAKESEAKQRQADKRNGGGESETSPSDICFLEFVPAFPC